MRSLYVLVLSKSDIGMTAFMVRHFFASSHCSFHFPRLHDLFHWSGPSLLRNTMVTILARADHSHHNKHICMMHKHTLLLLLLLLKFPTSTGQLAYPPWPRGLASQNWAVIKADTQVELYYQPLDTGYRISHRSSKIRYTGRSELKNLLEQQIHCGFLWAWRDSLKLFTVGHKKRIPSSFGC